MATTSQMHAGNGDTQQKRPPAAGPKLGEADIGLGAKSDTRSLRRSIDVCTGRVPSNA